MVIFMEAAFLLLTFLDMLFTKQKIRDYGVEVELNPVIKGIIHKLARVMRPSWAIGWGVFLGVIFPSVAIMYLGWQWTHFLAFALGIRFSLFMFQQHTRP